MQTALDEVHGVEKRFLHFAAAALVRAGYSGVREEMRFVPYPVPGPPGGAGGEYGPVAAAGPGRPCLHFVDDDAPEGPAPCTLGWYELFSSRFLALRSSSFFCSFTSPCMTYSRLPY
jgi:hypothetical protein